MRYLKVFAVLVLLMLAFSISSGIVQAQAPTTVVLLPEEYNSQDLIRLIGGTVVPTSDAAALPAVADSQSPAAVLIHSEEIEGIDADWLRTKVEQGLIIGTINARPYELSRRLRLVPEEYVAPELLPSVKVPYILYRYEQGSQKQGWLNEGSGIWELNVSHRFVRRIRDIRRAKARVAENSGTPTVTWTWEHDYKGPLPLGNGNNGYARTEHGAGTCGTFDCSWGQSYSDLPSDYLEAWSRGIYDDPYGGIHCEDQSRVADIEAVFVQTADVMHDGVTKHVLRDGSYAYNDIYTSNREGWDNADYWNLPDCPSA